MVACTRRGATAFILTLVAEEHVEGPKRSVTEIGEVSRVGPEHEGADDTFQLATWLPRRTLEFIMGFEK